MKKTTRSFESGLSGQGADGSFCVPDVQQANSTLINILHTCDYLSSI